VDTRNLRVPLTPAADLRLRWESGSAATGWAFASDWHAEAVDAVCEAVVAGADIWGPAERLGRERAAVGVSLGETLADADVLVDLGVDVAAEVFRRAVSLGWADRVIAPPAAVVDPLTGLMSPDYLHARLAEEYQAAEAAGRTISDDRALVVVRLDLAGRSSIERALPMMVVGDCLRTVFSAGQTLGVLSEKVAVVLGPRDERLPRRAALLHNLLGSRFTDDMSLRVGRPEVWIETLPTGCPAAVDLVRELGR
jgi:hypothetical protein